MLSCFGEGIDAGRLDREAFKFQHKLLGHPALSLEHLAHVIPALPKDNVMYSKGRLKNGDDFETTFSKRPEDQSIEETIEKIRVSDSYIMVSSPEVDASFAPLHKQLIADVEALMQERGLGNAAVDPRLFLFIASPNSVTPFHIDRYSTFLLQFRGSKQVCVFPPWDERVVSAPNREAYVAYKNTRLPWSAEKDALSIKFDFHPGEALHIPFVAGHHVRNGGEDVSVSMSIIFNTQQSMAWRGALNFNLRSRRLLARIGMSPAPVGASSWRDSAKSQMWSAVVQRLEGAERGRGLTRSVGASPHASPYLASLACSSSSTGSSRYDTAPAA
jgi:Cupin-like domain